MCCQTPRANNPTYRKDISMQDNFDKDLIEETQDNVKISESTANAPELEENGKTEIVGVRFKKNGKTYYFAPAGLKLSQDTRVIVDTSRGQEYGFVAVSNREVKNSQLSDPLRSVIRVATENDTRIHEENERKEIDAYNACIELIDKHKLDMKLIDTELSFDRSKILFYFSAEERVDFRELVKDLAGSFHTRIEMRQIGIRDEAKLLGGLGICGRPYCCSSFLTDFGQVSVKMAKEQNLSLNTAKITGSCGRLMCCLRYEYDTYLAEKALTPKVDSRVMTPSGAGVVTSANPLAGIVKVRLDSQGEDSEPVLFVREDCVDESKYDGRELTKTEIPKRGKKDDDIPSFAEFSSSSLSAAPNTPKIEPVTEKAPVPEAQNEAQSGEQRHKKHRHKRHKKNGAQQGQNQGDQRQNQNQNQPKSNQPQPKTNQKSEQKQGNQGGDQNQQGQHKKKKKFFHHHGKGGSQKKPDAPKNQ